jgi:hypothetical protein
LAIKEQTCLIGVVRYSKTSYTPWTQYEYFRYYGYNRSSKEGESISPKPSFLGEKNVKSVTPCICDQKEIPPAKPRVSFVDDRGAHASDPKPAHFPAQYCFPG